MKLPIFGDFHKFDSGKDIPNQLEAIRKVARQSQIDVIGRSGIRHRSFCEIPLLRMKLQDSCFRLRV